VKKIKEWILLDTLELKKIESDIKFEEEKKHLKGELKKNG